MNLGSSIHFSPPRNVGTKINYQQIEIFCVEISNRLLGTQEFRWPQRGKLGTAKPTHSKSFGASLGRGPPAHWTPGLAQLFLYALDGVGREEDNSGRWWKKPFPFQHLFGLWCWKQGSALVFLILVLWGQITGRKWKALHFCWYFCFLFGINVH